jgi:DNA-binding Lrp family transcriptional regulator
MWRMTAPARSLNGLDRRIVAALQVSSRASWRTIATVLGEPERTVTRRGAELRASGHVAVRALPEPRRTRGAEQYVFRARCTPGTAAIAARGLARRPETLYSYVLTGSVDCAAEVSCPSRRFADFIVVDLGSIPGVAAAATYPVLSYFRTLHEWRPDLLEPEQVRLLEDDAGPPGSRGGDPVALTPTDRNLLGALIRDGRTSFEDLARIAGVSIQTARRRVEQMRRDGVFFLRAIFEPEVLGLTTQALLWVQADYPQLDDVGTELVRSPAVRYAAALAGDCQLVVDLVVPDREALYSYLRTEPWTRKVRSIEPSLVVEVLKRSGLVTGRLRDEIASEL